MTSESFHQPTASFAPSPQPPASKLRGILSYLFPYGLTCLSLLLPSINIGIHIDLSVLNWHMVLQTEQFIKMQNKTHSQAQTKCEAFCCANRTAGEAIQVSFLFAAFRVLHIALTAPAPWRLLQNAASHSNQGSSFGTAAPGQELAYFKAQSAQPTGWTSLAFLHLPSGWPPYLEPPDGVGKIHWGAAST